jgi:CHAT domain-containing protein/tetratricopeptide (TPR) repeat protein
MPSVVLHVLCTAALILAVPGKSTARAADPPAGNPILNLPTLLSGRKLQADAAKLEEQGRYAEAGALYREVLALYRKNLGEESVHVASAYNDLGYNLNAQGKYAEAEMVFEKALAICRHVLGEKHEDTVSCYNNLGSTLADQGRYAEAEPLLRRALEHAQGSKGKDDPTIATYCNNLGNTLGALRKFAEAEPLLRKALELWGRKPVENAANLASAHDNLASLLNEQDRHAEALPLYEKGMALRRGALGENHPDTATSQNNVAYTLARLGKYTEAEEFYRKSLATRRRLLGEDHPDTVTSYTNVGINYYQQGKLAEAEQQLLKGAQAYESARLRISLAGLERAAFALDQSPLPLLAAVLARRGQARAAWQQLERSLARGLLDELTSQLSEAEQRRERELLWNRQRLDEQITALLNAEPGKAPTAAARKRVGELQTQRDRLQTELAELQAALIAKHGAPAGKGYDLAQIQAQLPATAALVAWVNVKGKPDAAGPNGDHWACLVRREGEPIWVDLAARNPDGKWSKENAQLALQVRAALPDAASDWRRLAAQLADQRLTPLAPHLGRTLHLPPVKHLILLPSVDMAGLPGEALVEAWAKKPGRLTVSYAPSGTIFAYLQEKRQSPAAQGTPPHYQHLLALGDPSLQAEEKGKQVRGHLPTLARLVGSRREVKAIADLFTQPQLLLGSEASEQKLNELARSDRLREFEVIHLATHALPDSQVALRSTLILAQDKLPDPVQQLLAGKEVFQGKLTAERILRTWKLNAEIVTLSACQTALGKPGGQEGYLGFAQALFLAGARSLVLSLWKVDDDATALLMTRFYQNLVGAREGLTSPLPKTAALEEAKRWLRSRELEEVGLLQADLRRRSRGVVVAEGEPSTGEPVVHLYEHPHYWAGFILIGDPGDVSAEIPESVAPSAQPVQVEGGSSHWGTVGLLVSLLVLVVLGVWWLPRRAKSRPLNP